MAYKREEGLHLVVRTAFTDLKGEMVAKDSELEQHQATMDSLMGCPIAVI